MRFVTFLITAFCFGFAASVIDPIVGGVVVVGTWMFLFSIDEIVRTKGRDS